VDNFIGRLKAIPIDPGDSHRLIICVEDLIASGVPIANALGESRGGQTDHPC
jgi:hypothetical protein